jgi:hypothetical protein
MPLAALPLRDEPWIASANIQRYDASVHYIYLKRPVGPAWERINLAGTPFVVTADSERCYLGALWTMISSIGPPPGVPTTTIYGRGKATTGPIALKGDARVLTDEQVLRVLKRNGQWHAGVEVTLDKVVVLPVGEGAAVRYTYTVTNRDRDPLYLLDTDRMDYGYFRRMQNGITAFIDLDGDGHVPRPNPVRGMKKLSLPHGSADVKWFIRLASGESMTRTATEPHFDRVPTGRYSCVFHYGFFSGYVRRVHSHGDHIFIGKQAWDRRDGRPWLGRLSASCEVRVQAPEEL